VSTEQITIRIAEAGDGAFEALADLHAELYPLEYGFGERFATHVYAGLAEFSAALAEDPDAGRLWVVDAGGVVRGGIGVTRHSPERAQLRWFLLHPAARGHGLGRELVGRAVAYAREGGFGSMFLSTVPELTTAAHLYREVGFAKIRERPSRDWGDPGPMQVYALDLSR
jgi:GNAT superfamily N-acetyltransferase